MGKMKPPKTPKTPKTSKKQTKSKISETPKKVRIEAKKKATKNRVTEGTDKEVHKEVDKEVDKDVNKEVDKDVDQDVDKEGVKASRQPAALPNECTVYRHTHLRQLSRRAQLRRAGRETLELLHARTTAKVFESLIRACHTITLHQKKKTFTRAILMQACAATGLNVIC
jgi:hypothetical protein